jgi:lipid II:glycine glycyltransferase (peptidoglycan interpeptide bridge formation enzyme)
MSHKTRDARPKFHVFVFTPNYITGREVYNRDMIELQRCTDQELWDNYILENAGHPLQLWGWGLLKAAHGWSVDRVFAYENEIVIAAAQILTRKLPPPLRAFSYVPRGPVGEQSAAQEFLEALGAYTKRTHRSVVLSLEPNSAEFPLYEGWLKSPHRILPAQTIALDLHKSESDLLANMVKKTRQYIRKSAAEAITIRPVKTKDELEKCLTVYHETSHRAQFDLHNDQYYYDAFMLMGEYSPVFAAYIEDQPVAFLWLAISGEVAFELYGGMNETGQELRANYALKWHAILKCKEWGIHTYDFGGLINDGVSTFKRSWSDEETTLAGTYDKPLTSFYPLWSKGLPAAKAIVRKLRPRRK